MAVNFPFLDPRQMAGRGLPNQTTDPRMATAAASMAPGVGDVIGLLSDASGYIQNPGSLTPAAGLLSVAGLIPGVPSGGAMRQLKRPFASDMVSDFVFDAAKYIPPGAKLGRKDWLEMLDAYKGKFYDGQRLPVEFSRIRKALKDGDISDELNAYLRSGFSKNPKDADTAWAALSGRLGLVDD